MNVSKSHHDVTKATKHALYKMILRGLGGLRVFVMSAIVANGLTVQASAADRYALIVSGAAGGLEYGQRYTEWRTSLLAVLRARFGYPDDHVLVLADADEAGGRRPTRENVRSALAELARRTTKDDVVLIMLMGHGASADAPDGSGGDAKFNLVGPDLRASEWADLVQPVAGTLVFVNGASGSAPFLQKLARRGRIVITATDSPAQTYETIFPEFFVRAFTDPAADADKNGRVSVWEAFAFASDGVRQSYQQRGQLQTERALLDDTGNAIGREAQSPGPDGAVARATYLELERPSLTSGDSELTALVARRADVQSQIDALRARKGIIPDSQYEAENERLLLELARLDAQIRSRR